MVRWTCLENRADREAGEGSIPLLSVKITVPQPVSEVWLLYCPLCGTKIIRAIVQPVFEKYIPTSRVDVYKSDKRHWVEARGVHWLICIRQDAHCEPCGCVVNERSLIARK